MSSHSTDSDNPVSSRISSAPASPALSTLSDTNTTLYKIDKSDDDNQRMIATGLIIAGERIHFEKPLITFLISPAELYNPATFFEPSSKSSGIEGLRRHIKGLPAETREAIEALRSPAGEKWEDKVRYNAYDDTTTVQDERRSVLRVYKDISRINHSCRPNAIVEWNDNPQVQAGTLQALTDIPRGTEIVISYLPQPQDSLKVQRSRKPSLRKATSSRAVVHAADRIKSLLQTKTRCEGKLSTTTKPLLQSAIHQMRVSEGESGNALSTFSTSMTLGSMTSSSRTPTKLSPIFIISVVRLLSSCLTRGSIVLLVVEPGTVLVISTAHLKISTELAKLSCAVWERTIRITSKE